MKALTQSVLAAAMLLALPFAAAEACTTGAWNGNTSAATGAQAAEPTAGVQRISGRCGLLTESGEFVTDNTPGSESTYQVQFYFRAPTAGSTAKIFSATSADGNTGTEAFGVNINNGTMSFTGVTGASTIGGLQAGRWYRLNAVYQASGAFTATVDGFSNFSGSSAGGTGAATTVGSASLGMLSGTAANVTLDEFNSTRSATPIAPLCRGDANGSGGVTSADRGAVTGELGGNLAAGFADCNMDGQVTSADRGCITGLLSQAAGPGCN